jgi:hypothetical protein
MHMGAFRAPGDERGFSERLHQSVTDRIKKYGKEPESFRDFWLKTELPQVEAILFSDLDTIKRASKEKCRLGEMIPMLNLSLLEGIGFGATYPELTESMWRQEYETPPDLDPHQREIREWAEAAGVVDPWESARLEQIEHEVLVLVAYFVAEYYPELVEPLGLVEELEEERKDVERQKGSS